MLDQIKIASPCSADWDQMKGNDQVRFCDECKKNVFNLSAMTRRDAEALIKETNGNLCARLYRRADGTVLTEDCPVGVRVKIARVRRRVAWAITGALGFATAWGQNKPATLSGVVDGVFLNIPIGVIRNSHVIAFKDNLTAVLKAETNQNGEFQFRDLEPGTYFVIAGAPGFISASVSTVVIGERGNKLHFILRPGTDDMGSVGQ
jgi:hypothetical protein